MTTGCTIYEDLCKEDGPQDFFCSAGSVLFTVLRGTGRILLRCFKASLWLLFVIVAVLTRLCRSQSRRRFF